MYELAAALMARAVTDGGPAAAALENARMNLALCRGLLGGLEATGWTARLAPRPECCCVVFESEPPLGST